ncbi:MAG: hypothetical protein IKT40_01185 [Bacilli bacterium]|nr:hypothetical protein [Bacilli bacterium]
MKKLLTIVALFTIFFTTTANAITLDEKIAKINARYEKRIIQIDNMKRAKQERKDMLKEHAKQNADLQIQQAKDLEELKTKSK